MRNISHSQAGYSVAIVAKRLKGWLPAGAAPGECQECRHRVILEPLPSSAFTDVDEHTQIRILCAECFQASMEKFEADHGDRLESLCAERWGKWQTAEYRRNHDERVRVVFMSDANDVFFQGHESLLGAMTRGA